jgi:hypothetical protein
VVGKPEGNVTQAYIWRWNRNRHWRNNLGACGLDSSDLG